MIKSNETTESVYQFIKGYHELHRKSPTIREIASGCFISVGSVMRHLDRLEMSTLIEREPNQARSIVLTTIGMVLVLLERSRLMVQRYLQLYSVLGRCQVFNGEITYMSTWRDKQVIMDLWLWGGVPYKTH